MPTPTNSPLARAQVIVAIVPRRYWGGVATWANGSAQARHERTRNGTHTLAVPHFAHSGRQPLIALLVPEGRREIIYVGAAYRDRYEATTGFSRLVLHEACPLAEDSAVRSLRRLQVRVVANPQYRRYFNDRVIREGGLLPPATSQAVIAELTSRHGGLMTHLADAFPREADSLRDAEVQRRFVFQQQRDAALLAFRIVGIDDVDALQLRRPPDLAHSFLDQLPPSRVSEEQLLRADAQAFPGMAAMEGAHIDRKTFAGPNRRLDLIFAHRERLEEITGADFIYYNATFGSFVLVQYKLLEGERGREFYRINAHMHDQMAAMRAHAPLPSPLPDAVEPNAYRVGHEACFWKFVSKQPDLETDQSLIPGYYLPLSLLQKSVQRGVRGGELIAPAELPRALSNTSFATLVRDAWVGTAGAQTAALEQLISDTLASGRAVTLAVHQTAED